MLNTTFLLTLATLTGLALGFAREWLFVDAWGAGQISDAIVLALFLPEALRMTLAAGILNAAALPLYHQQPAPSRQLWLNALGNGLLLLALVVTLVFFALADFWIKLLGPGLSESGHATAVTAFRWLIWCVPALFLQAYFTIMAHLRQRFILAGLGSFLFNLPPVMWLLVYREQTTVIELAICCVLGSVAMAMAMLPSAWRNGWRPQQSLACGPVLRQFGKRLGPLLLSNAGSQGLVLFERMLASMLGEGVVTWVNLARKLINLPLVALMALNQVLLSLFSARAQEQRIGLLRQGLSLTSSLAMPAAVAMVAISPTLTQFLFPSESAQVLSFLLAWFAAPVLFGAWNALLARYAYANNDTKLPLRCELSGSAVHAIALLILTQWLGIMGFALANVLGVLTTSLLLLYRQQLLQLVPWHTQWGLGLIGLVGAAVWIYPMPAGWLQFSMAAAAGSACLLIALIAYKPWRNPA